MIQWITLGLLVASAMLAFLNYLETAKMRKATTAKKPCSCQESGTPASNNQDFVANTEKMMAMATL